MKIKPKMLTPEPPAPDLKTARHSDWKKVLNQIGYPSQILVLDFETYFDESYAPSKTSTIEYIMDDRFEVLGLAVLRYNINTDKQEVLRFCRGEEQTKTFLDCVKNTQGTRLGGYTVVMHNANFDAQILAKRYGIYPAHIIDTLGLARHWNPRTKNGVGDLAKRFELSVQKGDTSRFRGWTNRVRSHRPKKTEPPSLRPIIGDDEVMWATLDHYAVDDVRIEFDLLHHLLPLLSAPRLEAKTMRHTLELYTRPQLMVDYEKGDELKQKMGVERDREVDALNEYRAEHGYEAITKKTLGSVNGFEAVLDAALQAAGDDPARYKKPTKRPNKTSTYAISKADAAREWLVEHDDEHVRRLMHARFALTTWPSHMKRIDKIMAQARANDDYLGVPLKYCGAHTGRWSGAEKINLQNLGSRSHELVCQIRNLLIAPPEHTLVITDASQIEARVLAWAAGQQDLLDKFASGEEIYCGFAEKVLGYPVRKPVPETLWGEQGCIPAIEKRHLWARANVGKVGILGCGYGMGAAKAQGYAGGDIDLDTAQAIVDTYRAENSQIVQFWHDLERNFLRVAEYKRPCEGPGPLKLYPDPQCDVIIELPNGRELKYHDVRVASGKYGKELRVFNNMNKTWGRIWGGHLAENVVQAMSRDILLEAIFNIEKETGYRVPLHVHDEVILVVPEDKAESVLQDSIRLMATRPEWAPELPLAAEGVVSPRYGGH